MKMAFFINRLLRMSPAEMLYRANHLIQSNLEKRIFPKLKFDYQIVEEPKELLTGFQETAAFKVLREKADRICEGTIEVFALKVDLAGQKINFHQDYKSGLIAPSRVFGKSINYRDEEQVGNIKYIWEINRLLFLLPLALVFQQTGEKKYLDQFSAFLTEWLTQNPFMYGVNWASSLELGIRLINWSLCWHLVKERLEPALLHKWRETIYRHCWFIERNFSGFSSANNHLIGEAAGLFIASVAMSRYHASARWQNKAYQILNQECQKQIFPDGVNKEQAINYHQHTLDYLLLSGLIGERYGCKFPREFWERIGKSLQFLAAIRDTGGNVPAIGDDDGGVVVDVGQIEYGISRSLLNTGSALYRRSDWLCSDREADLKTSLLLNIEDNLALPDFPMNQSGSPKQFPEGGYYLLGTDFGAPTEQKAIFDCGPLGYLSIAAHGHADALALVFSAGGNPLFIDPGTFIYHAQPKWRNYFRSTMAHNTVTIDDLDQSTIAGGFMWSQKARAYCLEYQDSRLVRGWHDGYLRLPDPVKHFRTVAYTPEINTWSVKDEIDCQGEHRINIYFHLHPDCGAVLEGNRVTVSFPGGQCELLSPEGCSLQIVEGSEAPLSGWYSPAYDIRIKTKSIILSATIKGRTTFETKFAVQFFKGM